MGIGLLPIAALTDNLLLKSLALIASIILNLVAIVKNFKEKKENKL